jgi:hypothetical protein
MDDTSLHSRRSRSTSLVSLSASLLSVPEERPVSSTGEQQKEEGDELLRTPRPPSDQQTSDAVPSINLPPPILSKPKTAPASSSADLILPLLIYLIVQYNPARLTSHLLYCQRFRSESLIGGEASYCATTISALIEFIIKVDIKGLVTGPTGANTRPLSVNAKASASTARIREKVLMGVGQELDRFVDVANTNLVNVVDSSYRMIFGPKGIAPKTIEDVRNVLDGAGSVASKARGSFRRSSSSPIVTQSQLAQREMIDIPADGILPKSTVLPVIESRPRSLTTSIRSFVAEERVSISDRLANLSRIGSASSSGASSPVGHVLSLRLNHC